MLLIMSPPPDLAPWVLAGVALHGDSALHASQFPALSDGMLTMRLAGDVHQADGQLLPANALILPHAQPRAYLHLGAVQVLGLILRPAALPCLLGSSLTGLAGCTLPLDTLPDAAHWRHTHQQLAEAPDDTERLARLFSALRPILHAPRHQANLHACQQLIQVLASTPLAATPPMLGLSLRQLQRRSQAMLGLTPKQYQATQRMQATLLAALRTPGTGADLAAHHGFFDQSHMARELRRLAGAPLRELRAPQPPHAPYWPLQVGLHLG